MKSTLVIIIAVVITSLYIVSCGDNDNNNPLGTIEGTCTLSGKVISLNTNDGLEDVEVILSDGDVKSATFTNQYGGYTFNEIPKDLYTVTLSTDSLIIEDYPPGFPDSLKSERRYVYAPAERILHAYDDMIIVEDFFCALLDIDSFLIVGKINDSNNIPVNRVKVIFQESGGYLFTNTSGFYKIYGDYKQGDTVTIVPEKEGYEYTFTPQSCRVTLTDYIAICNFTAQYTGTPLHSISGRIVEADGVGVSNIQVFLNATKIINQINKNRIYVMYQSYSRIQTDENGFYEFTGLKDSTYTLHYDATIGGRSIDYDSPLDTDSLMVILQGKDIIIPDIWAKNDSTYYTITGKVTDKDGNGISAVTINVYDIFYNYFGDALQTGTDGAFSYDVRLAVGKTYTWSFTLQKDGFSFEPDSTQVKLEGILWTRRGDDVILPDFIGRNFSELDAAGYFPLKTGAAWIYERSGTESGESQDVTYSITGTVNRNGKTFYRFSERGPWGFTDFRIDDNDVYAVSGDEEVILLTFGEVPGTEWMSGLEAGVYHRKGTFLGTETVETPAGTFENCAHFESKITYGSNSYDSYDLWYASEVGLVKLVKAVVYSGEMLEQVTDILESYSIP